MSADPRPRLAVLLALAAGLLAAGCGSDAAPAPSAPSAPSASAATDGAPGAQGDAGASSRAAPSSPPSSASSASSVPVDPAAAADAAAGVRERTVPDAGAGTFTVVPGSTPGGQGRLRTVRVEVEDGLPADPAAFADFALGTLNDPRGWPGDGWTFARTDGPADVVLTLASPRTSARMCRPLDTRGTLSCRNGDRAVLTWYRWVNGQEDYGADLTGYRQYVVNHEVGHALGHGHESCSGAGQLAPTMMQQTKGVLPCRPNPWPHP